jgi:MFS transporter, DHA1 family, tetracycline resistance protein
MSPNWYYASGVLSGLVGWTAVVLSSLSDVMPPKWRAPSFGLLMAGFSLGLAISPTLAILMGHFQVSVLSLIVSLTGLVFAIIFFPETLPPHIAAEAQRQRRAEVLLHNPHGERSFGIDSILSFVGRPIRELSILNRNRTIRLLACLAFFSGTVTSGNQTLLFYYLEERLLFTDTDVAMMLAMIGILGIFVQSLVLKVLNDAVGERKVIIISFLAGAIHNVLYGIATSKAFAFVAALLSTLLWMSFPTISAIKSNNVLESEQGQIQGALYSLQAIASGAGPMMMRTVYYYTKDGAFLGPGSMFVVGGGIMLIAICLAFALPETHKKRSTGYDELRDTLVLTR